MYETASVGSLKIIFEVTRQLGLSHSLETFAASDAKGQYESEQFAHPWLNKSYN